MLLLLGPAFRWHTRRPHDQPIGSDSGGDDYENLATLLAIAIAAFAMHKTQTTITPLLVVVKNEDSRRLGHVVVDARDRLERGGRHPSSSEAHVAFSLAPHTKVHLRVR